MFTLSLHVFIQEGQVFFCGMKYREEDFMVPDSDEVTHCFQLSISVVLS